MLGRVSRGFSLVELLLVVTVGAVLLSLVVPQIQRSMSNYRLASSAQMLATELNMARTMAVSRNTPYTIDIEGRTFQVTDPMDPMNPPRAVKVLDPGITFATLPANPIRFFSRGHAQAGAFRLSDGFGQTVDISVQASGTVVISDFSSSAPNG